MRSTTGKAADVEEPDTPVDGRSTRWDGHRAKRRRELIEATLRAIRKHGASVGMEDIAAMAGTSKTVFYRHFHDRAGLYRAVSERVDANIMRDVTKAVGTDPVSFAALDPEDPDSPSPRALIASAVDGYLRLVEEEPEIYRFIVSAPLVPPGERVDADPAAGVSAQIASQISALIAASLEALGRDPSPATTWGNAVVGMVRATGDQWLRAGAASSGTSRERLREDLTELIWGGMSSAWIEEPPKE